MAGGTSPWEWVVPIVGATHLAYNSAAQAVGAGRSKLVTQGSPTERRKAAADHEQDITEGKQQAEAERIANLPRPQTGDEAFDSRKRLAKAQTGKLGGKRASQYLAESSSALGVSA